MSDDKRKSMKQSSILSFFGKSPKVVSETADRTPGSSKSGQTPSFSVTPKTNGQKSSKQNGSASRVTNGNGKHQGSSSKDLPSTSSAASNGTPKRERKVDKRTKLDLDSSDDDGMPVLKRVKLSTPATRAAEPTDEKDTKGKRSRSSSFTWKHGHKRTAIYSSSEEDDNEKEEEEFVPDAESSDSDDYESEKEDVNVSEECVSDDSDISPVVTKKPKRSRLIPMPQDDDANIQSPERLSPPAQVKKPAGVFKLFDRNASESKKMTVGTPKNTNVCKTQKRTPVSSNKNLSKTTPSSSASLKSTRTADAPKADNGFDDENWPHLKLEWLKPDKLRDGNKRTMSDPLYDPQTLSIPKAFLKTVTPGHHQWWLMKKEHFDTVIFFKVGKFYELYHMDAVIANQELALIYMKGNYAHNGFPEPSYTTYSSILIEKGYKVARVEQVETPDMLKTRCKKTGKKDKVVNRAICEVSTKGVRISSFQNAESTAECQMTPDASYFYTLLEKPIADNEDKTSAYQYGVCFVDTMVGKFILAQFTDNLSKTRLNTMFSKYPPAQIMYCDHPEGEFVSKETITILDIFKQSGVRVEGFPVRKFWEARRTIEYLNDEKIFFDEGTGCNVWPEAFDQLAHEDAANQNMRLTVNEKDWGLALRCLGGSINYLQECRIHHDLLSLGRFELYYPVEQLLEIQSVGNTVVTPGRSMTLDSHALKTLEIVEGPNNLLSLLDRCLSPFGKRLLRMWLCEPLGDANAISRRLDAVEDLMRMEDLVENVTSALTPMADLEKLISKMHMLGSEHRSRVHPSGQAQLFEQLRYSKNQIKDFINLLKGIKKCRAAVSVMRDFSKEIKSELLLKLVSEFPNLNDFINHFDGAFDPDVALKDGRIVPLPGACPAYDETLTILEDVKTDSKDYLNEMCRKFKCKVEYFGSEKKRFQLQMPKNVKASSSYTMSSSTAKFNRYTTGETEGFLRRTLEAENTRDALLGDVTRQMFWRFDENRQLWIEAIQSISILDVLMSLAKYSKRQEDMCRPRVVQSDDPFLKIVQGRHPSFLAGTYIPNDCFMSSSDAGEKRGNFIVLTGANMGGKSTLMRQVGLLAILSHIGCYVPAESCELSTVDRVFTRIGANDNIGAGESTFQVEVAETASILKNATKMSLILIDELGRGTSTHDGTSIAGATAKSLASGNIRSIFATHYHNLNADLGKSELVEQKHMAFTIEDPDNPEKSKLTFMYVMVSGPCDKSYGFHAARISGVPQEIVKEAELKADKYEDDEAELNKFRSNLNLLRGMKPRKPTASVASKKE